MHLPPPTSGRGGIYLYEGQAEGDEEGTGDETNQAKDIKSPQDAEKDQQRVYLGPAADDEGTQEVVREAHENRTPDAEDRSLDVGPLHEEEHRGRHPHHKGAHALR